MVQMKETFQSDPVLTFDWTDAESVSMAVIRAVTGVSGKPLKEIEPIYSTVDPDALDTFFASGDPPIKSDAVVEIPYEGYLVRISATGNGYLFEEK